MGITGRPICTRRSVFVYVPTFSKNDDAGRMTSANSAVSVRKMSCTARNSRLARAFRTLFWFGSDRKGFSPNISMPRMSPVSAPCSDLDDREAFLGIERHAPRGLELLLDRLDSQRVDSPGTSSG